MKYLLIAIFVCILATMTMAAQKEIRRCELRYQSGGYDSMPSELREWLESEKESTKKYSKYVNLVEMDDVPTPQLVFIDTDNIVVETLFAAHVPTSMVQDIIKDKKFVADGHDEL